MCYQLVFNLCLVGECAGHAVTLCVSPSQVLFQFSSNWGESPSCASTPSLRSFLSIACVTFLMLSVTHCPVLENWLKRERKQSKQTHVHGHIQGYKNRFLFLCEEKKRRYIYYIPVSLSPAGGGVADSISTSEVHHAIPPQAHHFTFSLDLRSIRDLASPNTIFVFLRSVFQVVLS